MIYPFEAPAIRVDQPLGTFFVAALPANLLLETCHSIKTELLDEYDEVAENPLGKLVDRIKGTQRERKPTRLEEIRRYTETVDASFPNAIILGANYNNSGMLVTEDGIRWSVIENDKCPGTYCLTIPSKEKMASIIDGQHRVFGFENSANKDMKLLCSIFIDLPMPYHAQLFTKINTTQKRVDKNLAYNLFQFDMALGDSDTWGPETLAVYFARVLSSDIDSPLKGVIKLGVSGVNADSTISMASIIDGVLSLITSNAEADRSILHTKTVKDGRSRNMLFDVVTKAPLRELYLSNKDKSLYNIILSFFIAVEGSLWSDQNKFAIFRKTLGIHALFDFLKCIIENGGLDRSYDEAFFSEIFLVMASVDFNNQFYGVQSKVRARIRNTLLVKAGLRNLEDLQCSDEDKNEIDLLIGNS